MASFLGLKDENLNSEISNRQLERVMAQWNNASGKEI